MDLGEEQACKGGGVEKREKEKEKQKQRREAKETAKGKKKGCEMKGQRKY